MITYNNKQIFNVLFTIKGTVVLRCLPFSAFTCCLGTALAVLRELDYMQDEYTRQSLHIDSEFACEIFCVVVGFLLVVRTNMALARWMDGIGEIQAMLSKWVDAFTSINGFWTHRVMQPCTREEEERICFARALIAHWFALLSCIAFATLRSGEEAFIEDVSIKPMFPEAGERRRFSVNSSGSTESRERIANTSSPEVYASEGSSASTARNCGSFRSWEVKSRDKVAKEVTELEMTVLHAPTAEEVEILNLSSDKVNTISLWILQGLMVEVRAQTHDCPPPILSRVFQEMSDGMLGYHQAHKVAMVPFPFPFAQMVSCLLLMLSLLLPFYIDSFTQNVIFTPLISFVLPFAFYALNQIAVELEEPFGIDLNDVDMSQRHEWFISVIDDVMKSPVKPPVDELHNLEQEILQGYRQRAAWLLEASSLARKNGSESRSGSESSLKSPVGTQEATPTSPLSSQSLDNPQG